jgi:hypothetical protein
MKNLLKLLIPSVFIILAGCSGSDAYQGKWKATNADGEKFEIVFEPNNVTIKDSTGEVTKYDYTQNRVQINNSVKTYGIQLEDGRSYSIRFPDSDQEDKAVILADENEPLYTISRNDYLEFDDMYKLNQ